jgi:hypothetical protein
MHGNSNLKNPLKCYCTGGEQSTKCIQFILRRPELLRHFSQIKHLFETILYEFLVLLGSSPAIKICKRLKLSLHRPVHALTAAGAWGFQNFLTIDTYMWQVFQAPPTSRLYFRQISLLLTYVRSRADSKVIVLPVRLRQRRISIIPSGIKPANFRLVVYLNESMCRI